MAKVYDNLQMELSASGLAQLKRWEGCELRAYMDSGGVWTIGYGHISTAEPGMKINEEEATRLLLEHDLPRFEDAVNRYTHVSLTQRQYDALVIFAFNVGVSAFRESTLLRKLNDEKYDEVDDEFERWVYVNGKRIQGLANRRADTARLFREGTP